MITTKRLALAGMACGGLAYADVFALLAVTPGDRWTAPGIAFAIAGPVLVVAGLVLVIAALVREVRS